MVLATQRGVEVMGRVMEEEAMGSEGSYALSTGTVSCLVGMLTHASGTEYSHTAAPSPRLPQWRDGSALTQVKKLSTLYLLPLNLMH